MARPVPLRRASAASLLRSAGRATWGSSRSASAYVGSGTDERAGTVQGAWERIL